MASTSSHPFPRLQETVIDGRLGSPFFRREQLYRLYQTLLQSKDAILEGILKDSSNSREEALAELYLTLSDIKHFHEEQDPKRELELEYRVAHKQDASTARVGVGVVVISPQAYTFLYSTISPLCAAIAAGNCVAVVLEKTLRHLPALISNILTESLDPGILEIATGKVGDAHTGVIYVDQSTTIGSGVLGALRSPTTSLSVVIVDRTADLEQAAQSILKARVSFSGKSPYSPDLILINEFVKKEFLRLLLQHSAEYLTADETHVNGAKRGKDIERPDHSERSKGIRTIMSGSTGSIVDVEERRALRNLQKTSSKTVKLHSFRSLEDALEVANELQHDKLLAVYAFGDLPSSKYLLQFVNSAVGFANMVPPEILFGPAAPEGHVSSLSPRYSSSMFSTTYPKYSALKSSSKQLESILEGSMTAVYQEELWKRVELKEREPIRYILGYFARGIIVGASTTLLTAAVSLGTVGYFVLRKLGHF